MEGHTSCIIGSSLLIFGGKNEINSSSQVQYSNTVKILKDINKIIKNNHNYTLLKVMNTKPLPQGRAYHNSCSYRGKFMIILGGMLERIEDQNHSMRNIDILDIELGIWHHTIAKGDEPMSRIHQASVVCEQKFFIHGGYPLYVNDKGIMKEFTSSHLLDMGNSLFDTFMLNLETMIWRRISSKSIDKPLNWGHSAIKFSDSILVFGGVDISKSKEVGNVSLWSINKEVWKWTDCPSPIASAMHQSVGICKENNNSKKKPSHMFVFGGVQFSTKERITELREFNLQEGKWTIISTKGDIPLGRIGHSLLSFSNDIILMIGGVTSNLDGPIQDMGLYIYYVKSQNWRRIGLNLKEEKELVKEGINSKNPKPYIGKNYITIESKLDNSEYHVQSKEKSLKKKLNEVNSLQNHHYKEKFVEYDKNDFKNNNISNDSYDAPPPLPPYNYGLNNEFQRNLPVILTQLQTNDNENDSRNINEEDIFNELGPLLNVSIFDEKEDKNISMSSNTSSNGNKLLYVSPLLIQKMINSALQRDSSETVNNNNNNNNNISNTELSDDPFKYLRPTPTVLRWRQESESSLYDFV